MMMTRNSARRVGASPTTPLAGPARARIAIAAAAIILAACSPAPEADPRMVSAWMQTLYGTIRVERLSPPVASRIMGYATTALYSGLTAADPDAPTLTGVLNGLGPLPRAAEGERHDPTLIAISAERVVLDSLLGEALATTHAALDRLADSLATDRVSAGVSDEIRVRSDDLGRRIGLAVIAWSRTDGFDSTRGRPYVPPVGDGLWLNDAPGSVFAAQNM